MNNKKLSIIMLFTVAAIWGSGFIASQMALDANVSPALLMMVRFSVAAVVIGVLFFKKIKDNMNKSSLKGGIIVGLFLFLAFYVQVLGLQYTTPSNNAFLTATNVVMVPLIWWAISKKKPENKIFVSSILCLLGVGLLSYNFKLGITFSVGDTLTILCAVFFACQIIATGVYAPKMETTVLVFLQFAVSAVLSILVFVITDRNLAPLSTPMGLGSVLYLGLFSTCLCYFLQTTAQRNVDSSKAAIILGTEALFGSFFSVLFGYEHLTVNMILGGTVIMIALILTEWSPKRK